MVSINAIIGSTITPEPMFEIIARNPVVVPLSFVTLNFGRSKSGKPDGILPKKTLLTILIYGQVITLFVGQSS